MGEYVYVFDLDSTITKAEILPTIAQIAGNYDEMRSLTERTMMGELPFEESFRSRVGLLSNIPVSQVQKIIGEIPVGEKLVDFMHRHKSSCYRATGNLDCWIKNLLEKIDMVDNCYCSKAIVKDDKIDFIENIINKKDITKWFEGKRIVAIGDGSNDVPMIQAAEIGIGYGGVRDIASALLDCADYAFYDEERLCKFLEDLEKL